MMKLIVIVALIGAAAAQSRPRPQFSSGSASPRTGYAAIENEQFESENNQDGSYKFSFRNSDGFTREESGYLKPADRDNPEGIQFVQGSFSYPDPENGQNIALTYVADEQGFQAKGNHLPTSPPIPEAIAKSQAILFKNAADQRGTRRF